MLTPFGFIISKIFLLTFYFYRFLVLLFLLNRKKLSSAKLLRSERRNLSGRGQINHDCTVSENSRPPVSIVTEQLNTKRQGRSQRGPTPEKLLLNITGAVKAYS